MAKKPLPVPVTLDPRQIDRLESLLEEVKKTMRAHRSTMVKMWSLYEDMGDAFLLALMHVSREESRNKKK